MSSSFKKLSVAFIVIFMGLLFVSNNETKAAESKEERYLITLGITNFKGGQMGVQGRTDNLLVNKPSLRIVALSRKTFSLLLIPLLIKKTSKKHFVYACPPWLKRETLFLSL